MDDLQCIQLCVKEEKKNNENIQMHSTFQI